MKLNEMIDKQVNWFDDPRYLEQLNERKDQELALRSMNKPRKADQHLGGVRE